MKKIDRIIKESINKYITNETKEFYRNKLRKCIYESEDVMKRFYNIPNGCKPIMLEHITIDRIINKHGKEGFIVITANKEGEDPQINDQNIKRLISSIQQSGYSYLPTYGGYKEPDWEEASYEPSFIVFNNNKHNDWGESDFTELFELGMEWCAEFDQTCFLAKFPDEPAKYFDADGNVISKEETNTVYKNDPEQWAFTTLHTPEQDTKHGIGRRWTHDLKFENYVNPIPRTIAERRIRKGKGEIMLY